MADNPSLQDLAKMIDHSLLHPTFTTADLVEGCVLSRQYDVATACVKPCDVERAKDELDGSDVKVCAVAGFPHGNSSTRLKVQEAEEVALAGAAEVDIVVNIGRVLAGDWDYVRNELRMVNDAVIASGGILKVIFENDYLQDDHIIRLSEVCSEVGVAFIKTSTGYGFVKQDNGMYTYHGAQDHHLKLMREHSDSKVQVKAAGGIRTLDDLLRVRELGVTRVGATATETILTDAKNRGF
jgi:deoxyribose-phosphate aldolase